MEVGLSGQPSSQPQLWPVGPGQREGPLDPGPPWAPVLLPPPAELCCPVSLRILTGFPPRKGIRVLVYIPWELQAPRRKAALAPDNGIGLVFRCERMRLRALSLASADRCPCSGRRDPCPQLDP